MLKAKKSQLISSLVALSFIGTSLFSFAQDQSSDKASITKLIEKNYIEGVHIARDHELIREGFHRDFSIYVRMDEDSMLVGTLGMWLSRLGTTANESRVDFEINQLDITGNTACAKVKVFEDGNLLYVDYMLFYKLKEGWKIVSKVFEGY
jgi:hypothetical protein